MASYQPVGVGIEDGSKSELAGLARYGLNLFIIAHCCLNRLLNWLYDIFNGQSNGNILEIFGQF